jgi:hypothetical protein
MGVTYVAVAAGHPLAKRAAEKIRRWPPSSKSARTPRWPKPTLATMEKKGHGHRPVRHAPAGWPRVPVMGRQLRADETTAPVPSWPYRATTSATSSLPTKYGLEIRASDPPLDGSERRRSSKPRLHREGRAVQLRRVRRPGLPGSLRCHLPTSWKPWARASAPSTSVCATGASPVSVTGVRPSRC